MDPGSPRPLHRRVESLTPFRLILNKKSGPHNLKIKLAELNLKISKQVSRHLGLISEKSLQKKSSITDNDFLEILQDLGLHKYNQETLVRG